MEAIGLYQYHRPDPHVPYVETVGRSGAAGRGQGADGGLSNATIERIEESRRVVDIVSVQNEFSPRFEGEVGGRARALRLGGDRVPAVNPLGGMGSAADLGSDRPSPRWPRHAA